jgi:vacuolar-type H+-ATPase subunit D/Vma8
MTGRKRTDLTERKRALLVARLRKLEAQVSLIDRRLASAQTDLMRAAKMAHVAGMTEREIAKTVKRTPKAVHVWVAQGRK